VRVAAVVYGGVPNPAQSGSALTVWTVVRHLLAAGHDVDVIAVLGEEFDDPGAGLDERVARLRAEGAAVHLLRTRGADVFAAMRESPASRLRRALAPPPEELLPSLLDAPAVAELCADIGADVIYAYHWEAVAATRTASRPRLATVVDLPQSSAWYRWRRSEGKLSRAGLARLVWVQARLRRFPRLLVELLEECEASANFAAHHAAWLRHRGARGCEYVATPIADLAGPAWREARRRPDGPPRVLLIGHLRGISTLDGLDLFAESILPQLERSLGADGLAVRLVGGYSPPPGITRALARPSVELLGHLERTDDEFGGAACLLVPTTVPLGTRVRILSAFSFGCPVVAHTSNASGIPELRDGDNALLGQTADDLAAGVVRLVRDQVLAERIGTAGRATYEREFHPSVAAARIEATLARIAAAAAPRPRPQASPLAR
jgi:glycosyltransferase involved in cell wall biosynthesis